jgi:hypothetical protein
MAVPYTFATATVSIPLSQLDSNFGTTITLGNTSIQLGNTVTTLNNMTLVNVSISSGNATFTNTTISNVIVTNATLTNVSILGGTANALVYTNANIRSVVSTFPNNFLGNSSITLGTTAVSLGSTYTTVNGLTLTAANITSVNTTFPNNFLGNSSTTLGNTTLTLGSTTANLGNITLANITVQSGNVTANVATSTIDGTNTVGYLIIPQNAQTGNYTLVASDSGKHIFHAIGAAAATYTIPANGSVPFTIGTAVTFVNLSANAVSIAITTDQLLLAGSGTAGTKTLAQYGLATAVKANATAWVISGTNVT